MNDFLSGCVGGFLGTIISFPLDTIRIREQSNLLVKKNLFSGIFPQLLGIGLEKSIVFGTYNQTKKYTNSDFLAGLNSGFMASLIVTPIEKYKIMKQNNPKLKYSDITLNIKTKGPINGTKYLYNGLSACFFREIPGYAIYFETYNKLNKITCNNDNPMLTLLNGGLSGVTSWLFIFPFDAIKTNMQQNNTNFTKTVKELMNNKRIFNGLSLTLTRAFTLHSFVFLGYETSKKYIFI